MTLSAGDFATDQVTIERKTLQDLLASLIQAQYSGYKRIYDQLLRLINYPHPILMVSGSFKALQRDAEKFFKKSPNFEVLYGMIASVYVRFHVPTIRVLTDEELVRIAYKICLKVAEGNWGKITDLKKVKVKSKDKKVEILRNTYNINEIQAKSLLQICHSVYGVFKAPLLKIQAATGVGEITAKKIDQVNKVMKEHVAV